MDFTTLQSFLMWCTLINGGLLAFWTTMCVFAPDWIYRTQHRWFPLPREVIMTVLYGFLALYKIFFLVFNLVPYIALLIVG